ncbi:MAG: redoxin domain-containing protein [Verrucomicrobiae bacterium]|nr:redoxin domain-containing protein [Verrucomicrobiae bacterium]
MLVDAYLEMDQAEKAAPILQKRYDSMAKGADANLQELIGGVIQPLFAAYTKAGQKDKAKAFIEQAKEDLKSNPQGPQIMQFLDGMTSQLAMPSPGDTMDIAFTAMDGTEVDLSKMTDKVVLVDFWATWCGPCVGELPNVISAYEKYHDKGFEIIGISLDQDKGALEGFVKQRKMTWPQYFDGKGWENDLAKEFGIRGIPATFLIGKDGKIVVTDLRGDMLEQQLGKLLGEG